MLQRHLAYNSEIREGHATRVRKYRMQMRVIWLYVTNNPFQSALQMKKMIASEP